jgi:hypothetical protein
MATTRFALTPESAHFPTSNFPALSAVNARPVLAFDTTTSETCYWTLVAPQGLAGALSAIVHVFGNAAGTAGVVFSVAVEAITPADAVDLDSATSFDTANDTGTIAMPTTQGHQTSGSVTLTNADSIAAGDYVRISLARNVSAGGDTFAADAYVTMVEIREA